MLRILSTLEYISIETWRVGSTYITSWNSVLSGISHDFLSVNQFQYAIRTIWIMSLRMGSTVFLLPYRLQDH